MKRTQKVFRKCRIALRVSLVLQACFLLRLKPAQAQDVNPYEIGVVYYADGSGFKALAKETAPQSGHRNYSAKVKGSHAAARLASGGGQMFRVCGVDPSRYKLYRFRSNGNSRTVIIAKVNIWIGGSRSTLSESEVPVTIQPTDDNCSTISPKEVLNDGEYGFSPAGAEDVFMFGVGAVKRIN